MLLEPAEVAILILGIGVLIVLAIVAKIAFPNCIKNSAAAINRKFGNACYKGYKIHAISSKVGLVKFVLHTGVEMCDVV